MNYRHLFHAGNFADVFKHVLLIRLLRAMQKKEKGFLYLDTHAGRGGYDLERAASGDSLARQPEWPDGLGRLLGRNDLPAGIAEYVALVREFDRRHANPGPAVRFYPGSPWLAQMLSRIQDRLAFCEQHPAEAAALRDEFALSSGTSVQEMDGYVAVRAMLPAPERRAVVLIDPPFEAQDEFATIVQALANGLERQRGAVFAVWYPLTWRARVNDFFAALRALDLPPTLTAELMVAGESSALKMKGCGLLIVNPPWQIDHEVDPLLVFLARTLAQAPGADARLVWLVPEK